MQIVPVLCFYAIIFRGKRSGVALCVKHPTKPRSDCKRAWILFQISFFSRNRVEIKEPAKAAKAITNG